MQGQSKLMIAVSINCPATHAVSFHCLNNSVRKILLSVLVEETLREVRTTQIGAKFEPTST